MMPQLEENEWGYNIVVLKNHVWFIHAFVHPSSIHVSICPSIYPSFHLAINYCEPLLRQALLFLWQITLITKTEGNPKVHSTYGRKYIIQMWVNLFCVCWKHTYLEAITFLKQILSIFIWRELVKNLRSNFSNRF